MIKSLAKLNKPSKIFQNYFSISPQISKANFSKAARSERKSQDLPYLELTRDFIEPEEFYEAIKENNIDFFCGVPDSLLKDFCGYVTDNHPADKHIITANEGTAIAMAAGYHLATSKIPMVYLQNSGLGNIINPIMSLCHQKVYQIPMVCLIGWRGEVGKKDEPQHLIQGKTMNGIITEMGITFEVLPDYIEGAREAIQSAVYSAQTRKCPQFIIVKRQTFTNYKLKNEVVNDFPMKREDALKVIFPRLGKHDISVTTTGFTSREVYEFREQNGQGHERDFLTVGSMGHAASIAMGIAQGKQSRNIWCIDGDGSAIMHMGSLTQVNSINAQNYRHIILNNGAHDSVGAQPTVAQQINLPMIAKGCGYKEAFSVDNEQDLIQKLEVMKNMDGPVMLEVKIKPGARSDLGRPKSTPVQNKLAFMEFLQQ